MGFGGSVKSFNDRADCFNYYLKENVVKDVFIMSSFFSDNYDFQVLIDVVCNLLCYRILPVKINIFATCSKLWFL